MSNMGCQRENIGTRPRPLEGRSVTSSELRALFNEKNCQQQMINGRAV
jgi:hypothetical protein